MRIISKFHDYYDSVMAYGQDDSVVFKRDKVNVAYDYSPSTGMVTIKEAPDNADTEKLKRIHDAFAPHVVVNDGGWVRVGVSFSITLESTKKGIEYKLSRFFVIICGVVHNGVRVDWTPHRELITQTEFFYDMNELAEFLDREDVDITRKKKTYLWQSRGEMILREFIESWFDDVVVDREQLIADKVSLATISIDRYRSIKMCINPVLADIKFYKKMDAYTLFQELDMWVSGTLAWPPNFMVEVPDKYRLENHGFDPKYGFRTRPKNQR